MSTPLSQVINLSGYFGSCKQLNRHKNGYKNDSHTRNNPSSQNGTKVPSRVKNLRLRTEKSKSEDSNRTNKTQHNRERSALDIASGEWVALTKQTIARVQNILGCRLAKNGRQNDALVAWQKAADAGNVSAHFNMAVLYHHDKGGRQDTEKAIEHYVKASGLGHASSMYNLSILLRTTDSYGRKADSKDDMYWLKKAADSGLSQAQRELAVEYIQASPRDMEKAIILLTKSSSQNDGRALCYLGLCYQNGWGVSRDPTHALHLLTKSKQQGFTPAAQWLEKYGGYINHQDTTRLLVINCTVQSQDKPNRLPLKLPLNKIAQEEFLQQPTKITSPEQNILPENKFISDAPPGILRLPYHFNHGIMEDDDEKMFPHYGICDKNKMITDLMDLPMMDRFSGHYVDRNHGREKRAFNIGLFGPLPIHCNFAIFEDQILDF